MRVNKRVSSLEGEPTILPESGNACSIGPGRLRLSVNTSRVLTRQAEIIVIKHSNGIIKQHQT